jgi:hypothetical protein
MKFLFVLAVLCLGLCSCNIHKIHEKTAQSQAEQAGLTVISNPEFDASFLLSGADVSRYKKIILNELDFSGVKIIKPASSRSFQEPWELTEKDKAYYQRKFADSAKNYLFNKGTFTSATAPASDTFLLKTRITEIAPLASKDDFKSRPNLMDVYSEGFGRMTIVFELYDSVSNKLIALSSDEHDLGKMWEKNDRAQNNMQVRLAFDYWLKTLNDELSNLDKK